MKIKGLYEKRGWFYYQPKQMNGVRPAPVALRTRSQSEAVDAAFAMQQDAVAAKAAGEGRMREAALEYISYKATNRIHTLSTTSQVRHHLLRICGEWDDPRTADVTEARIRKWIERLMGMAGYRGGTTSPATVETKLRVLRGFFTWCVGSGRIRLSPMRNIRQPRTKRTRRQEFCTPEERERMLANPPTLELDFILHCGFFAGLRIGEILAMEPDWLFISADGGHGSITVQRTRHWLPKDKEMRTIPLHPRLLAFFQRYGRRGPFMLAPDKVWKNPPAYRFNPKRQLATHVERCGIGHRVTYHTLRHSFATHLAIGGAMMVDIAALLGDNLLVTESNYVGFSPAAADVVGRI